MTPSIGCSVETYRVLSLVREPQLASKAHLYLITVKGSRQAGLTGPKGTIIRKKAISKMSSSLETSLVHIKGALENQQ